jgi:glycosyltransferase involved in cell wall biosynthesis
MIEPMRKVFDVHIITLTPYPIKKSKKENHNKKSGIQYKSEGNITAVEIIKVPIATFLQTCLIIRRVIKKQKFDVCLTTGPYFGFATLLTKVGCPVIYEDTDRFAYFAKNKLSKFINRLIERYCIKKANHVISVGYSLEKSAKQIRGDYNVSCIPNGVNYKIFSEISNNKNRENIMIYVGTVSEWSGLDLVIRSIPQIKKEVPDIKLIVVGDGGYLNELKTITKKLGIDAHIELLGKKGN